jgi:integrase
VRSVHTTIRQALDQAVEDGLLARNVARTLRSSQLPKLSASATARGERALHPDQLERLLRVAAADRLWALWLLVARTGLRQGEARALRWSDLDWQTATLTVRRNFPAGTSIPKPPKSAAGVRPVLLSARVLEALREHHRQQAADRLRTGPLYADQDLIFCTRYGTPFLSGNVLRRFRQLLARAGFPASIRFHDLRHTAVSHQLAAGVPLTEVSASAGHASTAVTTQLYAHAIRRGGHGSAEQLEAFYDRPAPAAADEA